MLALLEEVSSILRFSAVLALPCIIVTHAEAALSLVNVQVEIDVLKHTYMQ